MLEGAAKQGTLAQAVGRAGRFGYPSPVVYLYEYYVQGTFDDKNVWCNIEKAVPQAMAEFNRQIFNNGNLLLDKRSFYTILPHPRFGEGELMFNEVSEGLFSSRRVTESAITMKLDSNLSFLLEQIPRVALRSISIPMIPPRLACLPPPRQPTMVS